MGLIAAGAPDASAAITTPRSGWKLAQAIVGHPSWLVGATYLGVPPKAADPAATAVSTTPIGGLPSSRSTDFAILSTGRAIDIDKTGLPNNGDGQNFHKNSIRGGWDRDATVLRIDLNLPANTNCLTFDFRFFSDEWDQIARGFNDAFVAELDANTWTTTKTDHGVEVIASRNFALDPNGGPISSHKLGIARWMTAEDAAGTSYNGATPMLRAAAPVGPGRHSLYLSIFDLNDELFDSTVIVDNLQARQNTTRCVAGVVPLAPA